MACLESLGLINTVDGQNQAPGCGFFLFCKGCPPSQGHGDCPFTVSPCYAFHSWILWWVLEWYYALNQTHAFSEQPLLWTSSGLGGLLIAVLGVQFLVQYTVRKPHHGFPERKLQQPNGRSASSPTPCCWRPRAHPAPCLGCLGCLGAKSGEFSARPTEGHPIRSEIRICVCRDIYI